MKKKYFKDNRSYFKYFNKYKDKINVIEVRPVLKRNGKSKICLIYKSGELAL